MKPKLPLNASQTSDDTPQTGSNRNFVSSHGGSDAEPRKIPEVNSGDDEDEEKNDEDD
jgi:hypothetical protein